MAFPARSDLDLIYIYKCAVPYMSRILHGVFLTEKQKKNKVKYN